jgi:hypothetical protein
MGGQSEKPLKGTVYRNRDMDSAQTPSSSTTALIALTQDITALISISLEATASLVHDWFRSSLGVVGMARTSGSAGRSSGIHKLGEKGDALGGMAVVVVGASEGEPRDLFTTWVYSATGRRQAG